MPDFAEWAPTPKQWFGLNQYTPWIKIDEKHVFRLASPWPGQRVGHGKPRKVRR